MRKQRKLKVLFVGSFKKTTKDGSVGGQMFASRTLINSSLSETVDWILLDTTANSNVLSSKIIRIKNAAFRVAKFITWLLFKKIDAILIFAGDGWSFWEKGFMAVLGKKLTSAKVILAPRSGFIVNDLENSSNLKKFIRFVFGKVDYVICQSVTWKKIFEKHSIEGEHKKFIVIENAIDFPRYRELPILDTTKLERVNIVFISWVTKNKGIYELVEAVRLLSSEGLNFHLTIAGNGDALDNVRQLVEDYNLSESVTFAGWVLNERKLELLASSQIFILPTYFDGYPNSLLEAMASAKACVATRVGSIVDMIDNHRNGIIIEKRNVEHIFDALKFLIVNPELRLQYSKAARETVESRNSEQVIVEKYKNLFNRFF